MKTKNITIQDIANKANVSKSTVSRVLNDSSTVKESKRIAVLEAMSKLNFQPNLFARGLAGGPSMTVGILTQKIGSAFYDSVMQGVIQSLTGTNYSPIFVDGQWKEDIEEAGIRTLLGRRVDGVIVLGGHLPIQTLNILKDHTPTIVVAREIEEWGHQCIYFNNKDAAYDATKYLLDAGHKQIVHITGIKSHEDAERRYQGYCDALSDARIKLDRQLVVKGNFDGQSGEDAIATLDKRDVKYTAIFAANDETAFGARLALYRKGIRVPEDVSIVGFDDQADSAYMTPPLTTVRQPALEMGRAAARSLLHLLNDEPFENPKLPAELVVRESVAFLN